MPDIPAKAGIQGFLASYKLTSANNVLWIPAFAGMTGVASGMRLPYSLSLAAMLPRLGYVEEVQQ